MSGKFHAPADLAPGKVLIGQGVGCTPSGSSEKGIPQAAKHRIITICLKNWNRRHIKLCSGDGCTLAVPVICDSFVIFRTNCIGKTGFEIIVNIR